MEGAARALGIHVSRHHGWKQRGQVIRQRDPVEQMQAAEMLRLKHTLADWDEEPTTLEEPAAYLAAWRTWRNPSSRPIRASSAVHDALRVQPIQQRLPGLARAARPRSARQGVSGHGYTRPTRFALLAATDGARARQQARIDAALGIEFAEFCDGLQDDLACPSNRAHQAPISMTSVALADGAVGQVHASTLAHQENPGQPVRVGTTWLLWIAPERTWQRTALDGRDC